MKGQAQNKQQGGGCLDDQRGIILRSPAFALFGAEIEQDRIPEVPMLMTGALFVSFIPVALIALMQRQIVRGMNLSEK